ncbi:hypothetical protein GCM10010211_03460 [Streptomyces albospinus]|uniref:Lipoprotein n=1 Tax=Streptomyces albospinus TaxID=285515 RepID=A0ABQ2ULA1_9ACTN|nr:hypothetical protein [Streptomyces albospinus]GGU43361.1 hypothetical protein GCM10010211_03460 [Streptomyces albospinus]
MPRPYRPAGRRTRRPAALVALAAAAVLPLTACSVDAAKATPVTKTFPYTGRTLKLTTHEVATELIAGDRHDIKVTRWFAAAAGTEHLRWVLKGDTLDIDAGCSGLALCDARFRVEVPRGTAVIKDGRPVSPTGAAATAGERG